MKKLLIHHEEVFLAQPSLFSQEEQFVFTIDEDNDVDPGITKMLSEGELFEKLQKSEVIFIALSLSKNYLEFLGLRLAYHIRLSIKLGDARLLPIVLIGAETFQFIGQSSNIPEILFTKGLYLMSDTKEQLERRIANFSNGRLKGLDDEDDFLGRINIPAPINYTTRHSLANEWSIQRWASMGKNFSQSLRDDLSEINASNKTLYFKFLERKHELEMGKGRQSFNGNGSREHLSIDYQSDVKIYYVDDEVSKGWGRLFEEGIFKEFAVRKAFEYYAGFQKGNSKIDQLANLFPKIEEAIDNRFNLFIIDLRLFDDDFLPYADPSGFEVIAFIKSKNPGVQMVIFTASGKAINVRKSQELGITNYLIKESPENMLTKTQSLDQFNNFSNNIKLAAKWTHLAKLHEKITIIRNLNMFHTSTVAKEKEFKNKIYNKGGMLDRIFESLNTKNESFIATAYLNCFSMLEKFFNLYYREHTKDKLGYVILANGNEVANIDDAANDMVYTTIELILGNYPYEYDRSMRTPIEVRMHSSAIQRNPWLPGRSTRGLVRFLAILHHRFSCTPADAKMFMELNFLRSNLAAHDTGKIDTSIKKIKLEDFYLLMDFCLNNFSKA